MELDWLDKLLIEFRQHGTPWLVAKPSEPPIPKDTLPAHLYYPVPGGMVAITLRYN